MKTSRDCLMRKQQYTCLTIGRVQEDATTMHLNHKPASGTFFRTSMRWQHVHVHALPLMFIFALILVHVQSTNAMHSENSCVEGERLSRFDGCYCGHYARIVTMEEEQELDEAGVMVFFRLRGSKRRKQAYVCIQCTRCGDGIQVDSPCTSQVNTKCSSSACADPSWKFDFGSKSCTPPTTSTQQRPHPDPTTVLRPEIAWTPARVLSTDQRTREPGNGDDGTQDAALWSQKQSQFIIIGVIVVVTILLILLVVIVILVIQMKHKLQQIASSPYSSQNTSKSSVNV